MRVPSAIGLTAVVGVALAPLTAARSSGGPRRMDQSALGAESTPQRPTPARPLPAGDAPAYLRAFVQPVRAPATWRTIYREVERCAGVKGDYDAVRWAVIGAPLQGPKGPTYAFTIGRRIVLVQNDTTYLRHEMLHHILEVAGWQPRALAPGEQYTTADLHPAPLFGRCTGGH